jgi:hypothetical protein
MEGQDVVTSDDHKLGKVVAERDGFAIVESGHMFKSRHAIPTDFLHENDGVVRATVGKEVVDDSPKVDGENFDPNAVKLHYGLIEITVVDPDPEALEDRIDTTAPSGLDPADTATFGGHPRSHIGVNDRSTKPGEEEPR